MEVDESKAKKRKTEEKGETKAKKAKQEEAAEEEDDGDKDKRTLFVRNLPFSVTEDQMYEVFQPYGECNIRILMDKIKQQPRGIAFVEYGTVADMKKAIAAQEDLYVGDRQAFVKRAAQKAIA